VEPQPLPITSTIKFVVRPDPGFVVTFVLVVGALIVGCWVAAIFSAGQGFGIGAGAFVLFSSPLLYLIWGVLAVRLWIDDRRIGMSVPFFNPSCPRQELASIRLIRGSHVPGGEPLYAFTARNGVAVFTTHVGAGEERM
jgi:hypothetical protein